MDLGFLDKSSNVIPLLVRLYDSHKLSGLADDERPLARVELLSAVTELLEMELSPREAELIADVLIGLMRQAELDMREGLAERLAVVDNVPLRLILQLANDEIKVAEPILKYSSILGDMDLIYIIKSKGPEYWKAIAKREDMSNQIINLLSDTRDFETVLALAENKGITLTEYALDILQDMAKHSDVLALPLLRRDEVTAELAKTLFNYVGKEIKAFIKDEYDIEEGSVIDAIDEVIVDFIEASDAVGEFAPTPSMLKAADRYKEKGLLTIKLMLGSLRRGQIHAFIGQFSKYTGLCPKTTLEIISQSSGQGLAVVCKAYELSKEDFISIFLLTNRVRNYGQIVDLADMTKAINYYNRIKPEVARGIVKNSLNGDLLNRAD